MSRMLRPSDSVSVGLAWLGSESTTNYVGVQPVGSFDIVLVGFEPESVRFRIVELARSDSGNFKDRTDWSSRMLSSQSEPGSVPNIYSECRFF